jgi:hypothetical protein
LQTSRTAKTYFLAKDFADAKAKILWYYEAKKKKKDVSDESRGKILRGICNHRREIIKMDLKGIDCKGVNKMY